MSLDELRLQALEAWGMSINVGGYLDRVLKADIAYVQGLEAEVRRLHPNGCDCAVCLDCAAGSGL